MPDWADGFTVAEGYDVALRQHDTDPWTYLPIGTNVAVHYNDDDYEMAGMTGNYIVASNWAFNKTYTITASTNSYTIPWAWDSGTTNVTTWGNTIEHWEKHYSQMVVTRTQSALQRAQAAARGAGDMQHDWDLDAWIEENEADPFEDEQRELLTLTYQYAWATAEEGRRRRAAEDARKARAQTRAEHLLTSLLSAEQKREWLENRWVTERMPSGRRWRLLEKVSGGQLLLDGETELRRATLCVHPSAVMPAVDVMVGSLLALRNGDEGMLLHLANVHSGALNVEDRAIAEAWDQQRRTRLAAERQAAADAIVGTTGAIAAVGIAAQQAADAMAARAPRARAARRQGVA